MLSQSEINKRSVILIGAICVSLGSLFFLVDLRAEQIPTPEQSREQILLYMMQEVADGLSVPCTNCHQVPDYKKLTVRKQIGLIMIHQITKPLETVEGKPATCRQCHRGKPTFLMRQDPKAVQRFMENFIIKGYRLKSGKTLTCIYCHVNEKWPYLPRTLSE